MSEELGRIEKPEAEKVRGKKKLFLVPLLFSSDDSPKEYLEKYELYWQQVSEHISNLESKTGAVRQVYHEAVASGGEEGLKLLEKLNPKSHQITKEKCQAGAELQTTEDRELADESMDLERHLLYGFFSQKVAKIISDLYLEVQKKRYEYINQKIDQTLKDGEAAILFIRENHRMQFKPDIEVFSVAPPALDEIHRWLREATSKDIKDKKDGVG